MESDSYTKLQDGLNKSAKIIRPSSSYSKSSSQETCDGLKFLGHVSQKPKNNKENKASMDYKVRGHLTNVKNKSHQRKVKASTN